MASIRQSVEVRVPLAAAYNQWTQFEDFPRFKQLLEAQGQASGEWRGELRRDTDPSGRGSPRY